MLLESDYDYTRPRRGQVRQAVVLSVSEDEVIVDLGAKRDGFVPRRHYGFIVTGGGEEIFFHQRQILGGNGNEVHEGQMAWFHVRHAAKGPEALNVELGEEHG